MKKKALIFFAVMSVAVLVAAFYPRVDMVEKEKTILNALLTVMNHIHFEPRTLDDKFSKEAFDDYLTQMDGSKRFLFQSEVDQLKQYQLQIDDQLNENSLEFFDKSSTILLRAIDRSQAIYEQLIKEDFNLKENEMLQLDGEKLDFPKNAADLEKNWHKNIKYYIVDKVYRKLEQQEKEKDESKKKSFEELVEKAQADTKELFDGWFKRIKEIRRSDRFEIYLNTITQLFDPHSSYFSPKEKQDFDMEMGGRLEGIGARLQQTDDFIKVVSIMPGGPAWKGKALEVDDLITAVTQEGEETVDIQNMRIDDVVLLIRGKKGTKVILTIKKKDGTIKDIEIIRDEIILDAAFATSAVLGLENQIDKVGYIKLPTFYSTFDGGNSCAEDVKKEINKLKDQNVKGIILDLRFNGGGSLQDVIKMSGLFIKEGPIVQVKAKEKAPLVYEDDDPGVVYQGPLIVMVNNISASASEILAAALQDYKRAVIVGSSSTYGKATVQQFIDLDRVIRGREEIKPLGQVKLTLQKFFRVNGGSNQLNGVIPDIILPDQYAFIEIGERENEHALSWSEIDPVPHEQDVYQLPDLKALQLKSKARITQDEDFQLIKENALLFKKNREETEVPIALENYTDFMEAKEQEAKKFENLLKDPVPGLIAKNLEIDLAHINADSSRIGRNEDWMKQIHRDVYLEESLLIMQDMLEEQ